MRREWEGVVCFHIKVKTPACFFWCCDDLWAWIKRKGREENRPEPNSPLIEVSWVIPVLLQLWSLPHFLSPNFFLFSPKPHALPSIYSSSCKIITITRSALLLLLPFLLFSLFLLKVTFLHLFLFTFAFIPFLIFLLNTWIPFHSRGAIMKFQNMLLHEPAAWSEIWLPNSEHIYPYCAFWFSELPHGWNSSYFIFFPLLNWVIRFKI